MTRKTTLVALVLFSVAGAGVARADAAAEARADMAKSLGFVPEFVKAMPPVLVPGLWAQVKAFESGQTALSAKDKELIGVAVAAQAGSRATVYGYTKCARASGANPAEVGEAVAIAAMVRQWSAVFNGLQLDEPTFRADIARFVDTVTKAAASKQPPPAPTPIAVVDARSALKDIEQTFGFVPDFLKKVPAQALAGLWLQMRDLEIGKTVLPGKTKSLISLAVASQLPCRYCIIADTEFAKLEGATPAEIGEAVTMAGMTRSLGALIDGLQVDEATVRRDFDRLTGGNKGGGVARRGK